MGDNVVSVELKVVDNLTKNSEAISQRFDNQMKSMVAMRKDMLEQTGQMAIKAAEKEAESVARIKVKAESEFQRASAQAAAAEAALVKDKFERQLAVESAKHAQSLASLAGNDEAQEEELRRHNAVVARIQMEQKSPLQGILGSAMQGAGLQNGIAGMAGMAAASLGAALAISKIGEAIHGTIQAAMDMQTIRQTLDFAAGSARQGAEDFRFLQLQAQTLGISMRDSAPQFARMEAAARGTALEGKGVKDVFKSMSEAAVTLHMNTDMASRGFYALQEMMSMGSVQTRQLRMLSLSLPGAFQDAAKAMGITTEEMMKMMAHGKVMTDDFLPKFAEVMREKYEKPSVSASDNARQSIQKFNNMIFESAAAVGETFLNAMGMGAKAVLKIADAYDAASIAAQHARKDAFDAKFLAGGFQDYGDAVIKATGASAAFQKQLEDSYNKAHPKQEAPHHDTDQQIENQVKLEEELQVSLAAAREDGEGKKVADENRRFTKEKKNLLGSHKEVELTEQIHITNLAAIHAEAAHKQADVEAEVHNKVLASQREHQAKIRAAAKKDQDDAVKRDEDRTNKIDAARDALAQVQNRHDPVALLKAQEAKELEQTNLAESAKLAIRQRYEILTEDLQKQAASRSGEILSQGLGVVMGLYHKHGAEYKVWAQAKNAVDTSMAAMAAYESAASIPYVGWIMGPVAAGIAVAAGLENASKINSAQFYAGGYTGSGNPRSVAGLVHRDEYVVNSPTVRAMGGPRGVESALSGGGGGLSMGDMHFHFGSDVSPGTAQMVGREVNRTVRGLMKNVETAQRRNIRGGVG